ncbi:hypothetical protein H5410_002033 [Solanum commersonii]|uniref:Uncharacterized protein n=1 Tax=Solanum commersonii TaxID=4109 RepID=A0A9J6B0X5_SOLCO|nr:hypothetical protein H5410_002033 [Solanum commersonii]
MALGKAAILTHENLNKRKPNLRSSCYLCESSGANQPSLLHRKWTDQLWSMFIQKRKIKWTKPGSIIEVLQSLEQDGNAEKMRRDGGLSQLAFGGQFGRKGIKDALKENRTIFRR